jgi:hypothetical protein
MEPIKALQEFATRLDDMASTVSDFAYEMQLAISRLRYLCCMVGQVPPELADRPYDYFKEGEDVAMFENTTKHWYFGKIIPGHRYLDGGVSARFDIDGKEEILECGLRVPTALKLWEYDYFMSNPDAYRTWNGELVEPLPIG